MGNSKDDNVEEFQENILYLVAFLFCGQIWGVHAAKKVISKKGKVFQEDIAGSRDSQRC